MQELSTKTRLRDGDRRLKKADIPQTGVTAVAFDLVLMNLQNLGQGKK